MTWKTLSDKTGFANFAQTFRLLGPFLLRHRAAYIALAAIMLAQLVLSLTFATFFGRITDIAVHGRFTELLPQTLTGIGLLVALVICDYLDTLFTGKAVYSVKKDVKNKLFHHLLLVKYEEMTALRSGDLMARFDNDMTQIEAMLGSRLIDLLRYPLVYICVFIYLFHINPLLSLISWLIAPVVIAGSAVFGLLMRRNSRQINNLTGVNAQTVGETLHGFDIIRSFVIEPVFFQRYADENERLYHLEIKNARLRGLYYAGGETAGGATFLASLCLGAFFVSRQQMTVGALMTFISLVDRLVYPLTGAAGNWAAFQRASGSIARIRELLALPVERRSLPTFRNQRSPYRQPPQSVRFQQVTFAYEQGKPILSQFNLFVPAGKKTAIVGFSGVGKTTIFSLLLGFYRPQAGDILLNGRSVAQLDQEDLRRCIAYVPQESVLFNATIRDNLLLGRRQPASNVEEALQAAAIADFIHALPDGLDTCVGEHGIRLSGGQKQRLAIARALLADAPILLLDEATSALDGDTEEKIKRALDRLMAGRTTIVIAHRLSTIRNADRIVVVAGGRVVQTGTHESLLHESGLYRRFYRQGTLTDKQTADSAVLKEENIP